MGVSFQNNTDCVKLRETIFDPSGLYIIITSPVVIIFIRTISAFGLPLCISNLHIVRADGARSLVARTRYVFYIFLYPPGDQPLYGRFICYSPVKILRVRYALHRGIISLHRKMGFVANGSFLYACSAGRMKPAITLEV